MADGWRTLKYLFAVMGLFAGMSCGRMDNPSVDTFFWDVQIAGSAQDEVELMGETDLEAFLDRIAVFPWYDQAVYAEQYPTLSPTVSVTDLKTDRSLFIAVGLCDDRELGFWVGYIYPVERNFLGFRFRHRSVAMCGRLINERNNAS